MVRTCWKVAAAVAGLALVVGCMNLSEHRLLSRLRGRNPAATPCCLETPLCDGMLLGDVGPILTTPGPAVMETPLGPPSPVPPAPSPPGQRLVPQPQPQPGAQPVPFNPNQPR